MAGVRTLVVTVSPLLAELVTGVLGPYLALDVVGNLQSRDLLAERLRATQPDLVIMGLVGGETDACALPLLAALPSAEILVLDPTGKDAWLHAMRPHRTAMIDFSVSSLVEALASRFNIATRTVGDTQR